MRQQNLQLGELMVAFLADPSECAFHGDPPSRIRNPISWKLLHRQPHMLRTKITRRLISRTPTSRCRLSNHTHHACP